MDGGKEEGRGSALYSIIRYLIYQYGEHKTVEMHSIDHCSDITTSCYSQ